MHVLVVFIDFRSVCFTCESCKALLKDIYSQGFVGGDEDINAKIEFVTVYQQWICHIP